MVAIFVGTSLVLMISVLPSSALSPVPSDEQLATQNTNAFSDVSSYHPNVDAIVYLKAQGIIKGYENGEFLPDTTINRAEFMKIIVGSAVAKPEGKNCFTDVKEEWFAPFICEGKKRGIVTGYADGTFKPGLNINAVEASKIVAKAFGVAEKNVSGELWYKPFVTGLEKKKAIPVSIDYAEKKVTRGEMSEMSWRLKAGVTTKATKTLASLTSDLPNLESCTELKEKMALQLYKQSRVMPFMMKSTTGAIPEAAMEDSSAQNSATPPTSPTPTEGFGAGADEDFSQTNVQVEGVDEADIVKNDGQYVYLIKGRSIRIVKATPAAEMKELSQVTVNEKTFYPSEMFVTGNTLVVVGNAYAGNSETVVYLYDITDRANVKQTRRVAFEGNYVSSRRIGNHAYFVMNAYPQYQIMEAQDVDPVDVVPTFTDSKTGKTEPVAGCASIRVFPRYTDPNFLIVAGIPLSTAGDASISRQMYLGSGNTIYSSLESLYVATQKYEYDEMKPYNIWMPPSGKTSTVFYRFGLKDGQVEYKTNGSVPGTLLNQFSMDESSDAFRVATTRGDFWGGSDSQPTNQLMMLDRNNLETKLGEVTGIGKGEKIKSVRFMGKRAYVVTFKNTDPFYVIDVENPRAPKILGELKIPGYSDYLHPYDDNHIIGFGKEAVDASQFSQLDDGFMPGGNNFAWYQGMKLAMFDVTDPTKPKEMFKEVIGDRGTNSELLYNHKALLFSKAKGLLAFPIEVAEIKNKEAAKVSPSTYGETVFRGAYVYNVDLTKGFTLKGKITHVDPNATKPSGDATSSEMQLKMMSPIYYDYEATINRLVYIGSNIYSISMKKVEAHSLSDIVKQGEAILAKDPDNSGMPMPVDAM